MGVRKGSQRGKYQTKRIVADRHSIVFCSTCNKSFNRLPYLEQHIKSVHLNYRASCIICNKSFISKSSCRRHMKNKHMITNYSKMNIEFESSNETFSQRDVNESGLIASNKSFPSMSNAVSQKESKKFGHHLIANRDIDEGEVLMATSSFASIEYVSCTGFQCFNCGTSKNLVQCEHCLNVWFCSTICNANRKHRNLCNSLYNNTDCRSTRLITEIINVATKNVKDLETFFNFSSGILFSNKNAMNCQPPFSQYGVLLKLRRKREVCHKSIAKRVVSLVKFLPQFKSVGDKYNRILYTLAYQHAASLAVNAFSEQTSITTYGVLNRFAIYDMLSKFNHSCNPNVIHYIDDDNITQCTAARRIKKGQQLFINYLAEDVQMTREDRQFQLKNTWYFECKCSECCKK